MRKSIVLWVAMVSLLVGLPAAAFQGKGKKKDKKPKAEAAELETGVHIEIAFGSQEKKIIVDWFSEEENLRGLPPGLAKREELPPGLQKHLVRNGTLPPGLQKKLQPLPADLEKQLPPCPDDTRRVILSGSVILLGEKTAKILDIIEDVVDLTR